MSLSREPYTKKAKQFWVGKTVNFSGYGGTIFVNVQDGSVQTGTDNILLNHKIYYNSFPLQVGVVHNNGHRQDDTSVVSIQHLGISQTDGFLKNVSGGSAEDKVASQSIPLLKKSIVVEHGSMTWRDDYLVALRVEGTDQYLTVNLYGDVARQNICKSLAEIPTLLPELIPLILDFTVGNATDETNFEGKGFNYAPITAQPLLGKQPRPNMLQLFHLVPTRSYSAAISTSVAIRTLFGTYWRSEHWNRKVSQAPHCRRDETWRIRAEPCDT